MPAAPPCRADAELKREIVSWRATAAAAKAEERASPAKARAEAQEAQERGAAAEEEDELA